MSLRNGMTVVDEAAQEKGENALSSFVFYI